MTEENKTRGHGAGGANTNKNGLSYETLTDLNSEFLVTYGTNDSLEIVFNNDTNGYKLAYTKQKGFSKFMNKYYNSDIPKAHGCKNPDESFIHLESKTIFIIEKKFQTVSGSVCEKIQTGTFKKWNYSQMFPDFNVIYIYCLSDWFKANCKAEIIGLSKHFEIPVFYGSDEKYKTKMVNFILRCISCE